ncbi:MAG: GNAT family N-acetyltransferase [Acidimicrobiia bacterium]
MDLSVRDDSEHSRYELSVDGVAVGFAEYVLSGSTIVFPHTVIDPDRRGHGLGAVLVRAALDDARDHGRSVVPECWYVRAIIDQHPEYRSLVAP